MQMQHARVVPVLSVSLFHLHRVCFDLAAYKRLRQRTWLVCRPCQMVPSTFLYFFIGWRPQSSLWDGHTAKPVARSAAWLWYTTIVADISACCRIMHIIRPQQGGYSHSCITYNNNSNYNNNYSNNNCHLQVCQLMQKCKTLSAVVETHLRFFHSPHVLRLSTNKQRCKHVPSEVYRGLKGV